MGKKIVIYTTYRNIEISLLSDGKIHLTDIHGKRWIVKHDGLKKLLHDL